MATEEPSSTASLRNTPHEQAGFHFQQCTFNRAQRRERLVKKWVSGEEANSIVNERKSEREKQAKQMGSSGAAE